MNAEAINPWINQQFDASFRNGFENVTPYPPDWFNIKTGKYTTFLSGSPDELQQAFDERSEIGARYQAIQPKLEQLGGDLSVRVAGVFQFVLDLSRWRDRNNETGLQVPDVGHIQNYVDRLIQPDEFPQIAQIAFEDWGPRLANNEVVHITQANTWMAAKIADHFRHTLHDSLRHGDLGTGAGSTIKAIHKAADERKIKLDTQGIELTPVLAALAKENTDAVIREENMIDWLNEQPDNSIDLLTISYAIHHLPYKQQYQLKQLAFQKLRYNGILAIADPTGMSAFNRYNLDIKEPEAVIADFTPSVAALRQELQEIGFAVPVNEVPKQFVSPGVSSDINSTDWGNVLDQGDLGYAIIAIKNEFYPFNVEAITYLLRHSIKEGRKLEDIGYDKILQLLSTAEKALGTQISQSVVDAAKLKLLQEYILQKNAKKAWLITEAFRYDDVKSRSLHSIPPKEVLANLLASIDSSGKAEELLQRFTGKKRRK